MSDEWPSFSAELTRKTTEQLQIFTDRFDQGAINLVTMLAVVAVLYDATSGMIEKEVSDLLADIHKDLTTQARALLGK